MILDDVRKKFRDLSGRYDLVNEDGSDNGANFFINAACRWLDKTVETPKSGASYLSIQAAGAWYVKFPHARAIKEVWITSSSRWQLDRKRLQDIIAEYYTKLPASLESGSPEYFSPAITRNLPIDMTPATLTAISAYIGVIPNDTDEYNAVIFSCPLEQEALVEVIGLFYSTELSNDEDENYWTRVNPLLLIQTAIRQTYIIGGNKPMLDVLDRGIDGDLERLEKDTVEQEIAMIDQMEG